MLYGLYLSAQGAQSQATQLEVTANNIANAGTNAFKKDLALFQNHRPHESHVPDATFPGNLERSSGGVTVRQTATDFTQAPLNQTGGPLDLALSGPGFFSISDGNENLLTRDGRFTKNATGELVTADGGLRVLSTDGTPIQLDPATVNVTVADDGTVTEHLPSGERNAVGRLAVLLPQPPTALEKVGNGRYRGTAETIAVDPALTHVAQGFVEASGVNPVTETLNMIQASRNFETNINMMKIQDESLSRLLTALRP